MALRYRCELHIALVFFICFTRLEITAKKADTRSLIEDLNDPKEFRKLLRTKNNVLVLFAKSGKAAELIMSLYPTVAEEVRGQATLAFIDCSAEGKKLCKKLKVSPEETAIKHYKDGEFHKDYDRKETFQSMVNFLKDPSGDPPWDEDETSKDVIHVTDASALGKLLHKEKLPIMMMFYVPWCGYCKRLKPEYAMAATNLKDVSIFAAMDVNKAENAIVRKHFNISGFPTLLYFENGSLRYKYEGENTKEALAKFIKNPGKSAEKPKEEDWAETESYVVHLTEKNFDQIMKAEQSVLVMFYAPWCGHCKKMKPEYVDAAAQMKEKKIVGMIAALDATKQKSIAERFQISGYPAIKYFKNGELLFDANVRTADKIIEFMKNPKEPLPPPPPELPWHKSESDVVHLNEENFKETLKRKKHVLVMFYAPWCGHCKKVKPEYQTAATFFKDDSKVELAAVDCTENSAVCSAHQVQGYPTFKYFNYFKNSKQYDGGRTEKDFMNFMKNVQDPNFVPGVSPSPPAAKIGPKEWWSEISGSEHIHHLTEKNFDAFIEKENSVLVLFYTQWCGHCQNLKPIYGETALKLLSENVFGKLAAVDAISERELATKFNIRGFPMLKYFSKGAFLEDYQEKRNVQDLLSFMKRNLKSVKKEL